MKCGFSVRALLLAAGSVLSMGAIAQGASNRAGKIDTSFLISYVGGESITGNQGSSADIDPSIGWGAEIAYNVDKRLALGAGFSTRSADYDTVVVPDAANPDSAFDRSGDLWVTTGTINGTYHFLPTRLTPFVTVNGGRTWVNTDIPDGPPSTACWIDPWWGYYCGPSVPTKADSYWAYGGGLGLRWETGGLFFMRASVNGEWLDIGGAAGTKSFTQYRIDLGGSY